jgi:predicted DNA-binding helix-hairpin-helix protein
VRSVDQILASRRFRSIRAGDLKRLHVSSRKVLPFLVLADHRPSTRLIDTANFKRYFVPEPSQLSLAL